MRLVKLLFSFKGRIGLDAIWFFSAVTFLSLFFIVVAFGVKSVATYIGIVIIELSYLSMIVRRCHDLGKNGFFLFIPYAILLLYFKSGSSKPNKYGDPDYILQEFLDNLLKRLTLKT